MLQLRPDQARVSALLKETITLMCKNGLTYDCKFSIDAVIGVTLDEKDSFFISMNDIIKSDKAPPSDHEDAASDNESKPRPRKRRKRSTDVKAEEDSDDSITSDTDFPLPGKLEPSDNDDEDSEILFIKEEPSTNWVENYNEGTVDESQQPSQSDLSYPMIPAPDLSQDTSNVSFGEEFAMSISSQVMRSPSSHMTTTQYAGQRSSPGQCAMGQGQINQFRVHNIPSGAANHHSAKDHDAPDDLSQYMASMPQSGTKRKPNRVCVICGKRFTSQYGYQVHLKRHAGIHPYKCDVCGKGMSSKTNLDEHMRHHTGELLGCNHCGRTFITLRAHRTHVITCVDNNVSKHQEYVS